MSKGGKGPNSLQQFFGQARYAAYYLIFKQKRIEQFDMFMSNPDIDLWLKIYNIPETEFIQKLTEVTLPNIKLHQVVYLPMLDDILTVESLEETADNYQKYWKEKSTPKEENKTSDPHSGGERPTNPENSNMEGPKSSMRSSSFGLLK